MVTHSMENILNMQYYAPVSDEALHSPPSRKKRCLAKEVNFFFAQHFSRFSPARECEINFWERLERDFIFGFGFDCVTSNGS